MIALGVVAIPLTLHIEAQPAPVRTENAPQATRDPRVARLQVFLRKLHCPVAPLSEDFVRAADQNNLDWRLLPSIALIESSGGKAYKNNNIFGWRGGEQVFDSIKSGLELVAYKLGRSSLYRKHDSLGKLRIYNPNEDYADSVMAVMNRISPEVSLQPVSNPAAHRRRVEQAALVRD